MTTRRQLLAALPLLALIRPAQATPAEMTAAIAAYTSNASIQRARVTIDIAQLIDNGNAVPITVRVDSPMTEQSHVTDIAIFNEKNPPRRRPLQADAISRQARNQHAHPPRHQPDTHRDRPHQRRPMVAADSRRDRRPGRLRRRGGSLIWPAP